MARVSEEALIRVLAAISVLVVAVVLTGCGEVGELGSGGEETTTAAPDEQTEEGRVGDPPAVRDTEEETSDTTEEWAEEEEEAPAEPTDEWAEEEEPGSEPTDEGEPEEEAAPEDSTGGDTESDEDAEDGDEGDESGGEAYTYSGSGSTVTETAHLEGDYTVTFHVSDNLLMDMESYFAAFLTNVDDEIDVWMLVDEITTETSGTTNVYGLDGDYYIDVMADGDWSFEFTPQ